VPIEYTLLKNQPCELNKCPQCDAQPFKPFIRGTVQRNPYPWYDPFGWLTEERPYCALICSKCKNIVGYEGPRSWEQILKNRWAEKEKKWLKNRLAEEERRRRK